MKEIIPALENVLYKYRDNLRTLHSDLGSWDQFDPTGEFHAIFTRGSRHDMQCVHNFWSSLLYAHTHNFGFDIFILTM